jgi:hypothetical protein
LPAAEFGFAVARLETVIRRHGFVSEPVLWQIVSFVGAAAFTAVGFCAAVVAVAEAANATTAPRRKKRFT